MPTMKNMTVVLSLAALMLSLAACQPYVNIPPQEADTASHDPNGKAVREVLSLAITAAIEDAGITSPVQVMLPPNTNKLTYAAVLDGIGDQAVSPFDDEMSQQTQGVVSAKGVRIRAARAEVDVARPVGDGVNQLVTVYLKWEVLGGWRAQRVHVWRGVPIEEPATATESSSS